MDKVLATFNGEANFLFYIEKAVAVEKADPADSYEIVGVASTPNIDHDMERMALPALKRMARQITYEGVPLRVEHQKNDDAIIGKINEAWVDDSNKLWIKAKLTKGNLIAEQLHESLVGGAKLGLSVGGRVKQAIREMSEHQGKMIKTFFDVILDEVSVTPRPSNYDAWLVNKHIISEGDNADALFNTPLHNSFLLENPKFDYLMAIEKSIPREAWTKVDNTNNINMDYITKKEFNEFQQGIFDILRKFTESDADGKTRMMDAPAAMPDSPKEQNFPDQVIEENPAQVRTVKEQTQKTGANGSDEHGQREKNPGEGKIAEGKQEPHDQDNGTEKKDENPAQVRTVKSGARTMIDRLSARFSKMSSSDEKMPMEAEKAGDKSPAELYGASETYTDQPIGDQKKTAEKEMPPQFMTSSKEPKSETKEKEAELGDEKPMAGHDVEEIGMGKDMKSSEDEEEGSMDDYNLPEVRRSIPALDAYSVAIGQFIDDAEARLQKGGKRIPGLRRTILDFVKQDPAIQKQIREMMRLPGLKKSVVGGTPVTWTKDGTRLKLVSDDSYVQKSFISKDAKFGDVYKANFSSREDKGQQNY